MDRVEGERPERRYGERRKRAGSWDDRVMGINVEPFVSRKGTDRREPSSAPREEGEASTRSSVGAPYDPCQTDLIKRLRRESVAQFDQMSPRLGQLLDEAVAALEATSTPLPLGWCIVQHEEVQDDGTWLRVLDGAVRFDVDGAIRLQEAMTHEAVVLKRMMAYTVCSLVPLEAARARLSLPETAESVTDVDGQVFLQAVASMRELDARIAIVREALETADPRALLKALAALPSEPAGGSSVWLYEKAWSPGQIDPEHHHYLPADPDNPAWTTDPNLARRFATSAAAKVAGETRFGPSDGAIPGAATEHVFLRPVEEGIRGSESAEPAHAQAHGPDTSAGQPAPVPSAPGGEPVAWGVYQTPPVRDHRKADGSRGQAEGDRVGIRLWSHAAIRDAQEAGSSRNSSTAQPTTTSPPPAPPRGPKEE